MEREQIRYTIPNLAFYITSRTMRPDVSYRRIHYHSAVELIFVTEGVLNCHIQEEILSITPGTILLIGSNTIHRLSAGSLCQVTYMQIDLEKYIRQPDSEINNDFLAFFTQLHSKPYALFENNAELFGIVSQMAQESQRREVAFESYIYAGIHQLVAFLYRHGFMEPAQKHLHHRLQELSPVVEYIGKNYKGKLLLDELAALISCDKYRLCRRFKQITGGTVVDYIHFVRLRRAQELLTYSSCNVTETAYACGFASVQHFNKIFKKYLGCTPSAYKKWTYQESHSI